MLMKLMNVAATHCESAVIGAVKKKKKKYLQKFKPQYKKDFPDMISSSKGAEWAFCTKCKLHFTISHGGKNDIKRHVSCESHKSSCASSSGPQITNFFTAAVTKDDAKGKLEDDITKAEATLCRVIGHCNMPIATADMLTQCVKYMFPDSKIAAGKSDFSLIWPKKNINLHKSKDVTFYHTNICNSI